jgi:hypothetical protein
MLRVVARGPKKSAPLPEGTKQRPLLHVKSERILDADEGRAIGIARREANKKRMRPAWIDPWEYAGWVPEADGSALLWSGHRIVLLDKNRRPEASLNFEPLRGDLVRHVFLCCDHAVVDRGTVLGEPRRIGNVIFTIASDMERDDMDCILAVDPFAAVTLWKTPHGVAPTGFEIVRGHAIASSKVSGRWALVVVELDTGKIVDRVPTARGPYRLTWDGADTLRGYSMSNEVVTEDGKSRVLEVSVE